MTGEQSRESGIGAEDKEDVLLSVRNLQTHFPVTEGILRREVGRVRAVDGVSFALQRGEILGIVGESGSGKTTVAHSILQLQEPTAGEIWFDGNNITALSARELRSFRRRAQLIVQDPNEAFNPRMKVRDAIAEPLLLHGIRDASKRRAIVEDIVERVGLSADDGDRYPHEFSGGEKQRLAIARSLVVNPDLIIADEPTSALDDRVQSDILALLDRIRREHDIAVVFISHNIELVRRFCDRIAVMYLGEIVEKGRTKQVIEDPAHPYTQALVGSVPTLEPGVQSFPSLLTDTVPDPSDPPNGCRFHTRCPSVIAPPELSIEAETWTALAGYRFTLEARELPPEVEEAIEAEQTEAIAAIREAFDIPKTTGDDSIDAAMARSMEALASGDTEAAASIASDALPTICETTVPNERQVGSRSVRCHLYDDSGGAE